MSSSSERRVHSAPDLRDGAEAANGEEQLRQLRDLLVGSERERLERVERAIGDRTQLTEGVSEVLPDAIRNRQETDDRLASALTPTIEDVLQKAVRNDPQTMAEAIFPVLGPAIRKAISHTIAGLVQSINQTMEQALSADSLKWRLQAWRTGRPFSEIVLANSFIYKVEQILIIHAETGMLLQEVVAPEFEGKDPDLVSAMLTALQDFVRDSWDAGSDQHLEGLRVGDRVLIVERGPRAIGCLAVRGVAPPELRVRLVEAIESVHEHADEALRSFDGDSSPFEVVRPALETCLSEQRRPPEPKQLGRKIAVLAVLALIGLAALWWAFAESREERLWRDYQALLEAAPGIVVMDTGFQGGRFTVVGLRDPLAQDPERLLRQVGLPLEQVESRWEPYFANHAPFAMSRTRRALGMPNTGKVDWADGVLRVSGTISGPWVREARRLTGVIPTIHAVDASCASFVEFSQLEAAIEFAGALTVDLRGQGANELTPESESRLSALVAALLEVDRLAHVLGRRVIVDVIGSLDPNGFPPRTELVGSRAGVVVERLAGYAWRTFELRAIDRAEPAEGREGQVFVRVEVVEGTPR